MRKEREAMPSVISWHRLLLFYETKRLFRIQVLHRANLFALLFELIFLLGTIVLTLKPEIAIGSVV